MTGKQRDTSKTARARTLGAGALGHVDGVREEEADGGGGGERDGGVCRGKGKRVLGRGGWGGIGDPREEGE